MVFSWFTKKKTQSDAPPKVSGTTDDELSEFHPTYFMTHRWGAQTRDFPLDLLDKFYDELLKEDDEHPDLSLQHESSWVLSAFPSGLVVYENVEGEGAPQHMKNQTKEDVVRLWRCLAAGEFDVLNGENWLDGYG